MVMHSHKTKDYTSVFDEGTLYKAYRALRDAGIDDRQAEEAISAMQNAGILFRERPPAADVNASVMRGGLDGRNG